MDNHVYQCVNSETNVLIDIGLEMVELPPTITKTLEGMIATFFVTAATSLTISLYILIASTFLNIMNIGVAFPLLSSFYVCLAFNFYIRLFYLMNSGYHLAEAMKESKTYLEKFRLIQYTLDFENNSKLTYKMDLLQSKLAVESPIKPYSMISISNQAFMGTLTSILTYLVILIRFRKGEQFTCCDMYNTTMV